SDLEDSFKVVDSSGNTVIRHPVKLEPPPKTAPDPAVSAPPPRLSPVLAPAGEQKSPSQLLASIEDAQRREVGALKAMVELLIGRGIFTREEYLARLKR